MGWSSAFNFSVLPGCRWRLGAGSLIAAAPPPAAPASACSRITHPSHVRGPLDRRKAAARRARSGPYTEHLSFSQS